MFGGYKEFVVGLLFVAFTGNADAFYQQCQNCSAVQMEASAKGMGKGTWVVWNPANADVRKYDVTCGIVNGVDPTPSKAGSRTVESAPSSVTIQAATCTAVETVVPQGVIDTAVKLLALSQHTGGTYKAQLQVSANNWQFPTQPGPTAFTYVTDANYRGQLNDKLGQQAMLYTNDGYTASLFTYLIAHMDATYQFTDGVEAIIDLLFNDGSKVKIRLKLDESATYIDGSARDNTAQAIPDENSSHFTGRWVYGSNDPNRDNMNNLLHSLGAEVIVGTQSQGFLTCSWDAASTRLTCHWSSY